VHRLYYILLMSILLLSGCDNPFSKNKNIPVENTTEFAQSHTKKRRSTIDFQKRYPDADTFTLVDMHEKKHKITLANKKVLFHEDVNDIVIINIFSSWCPPCMSQLPYLSDLQKKYKDTLFVASLLVNDDIEFLTLQKTLKEEKINHYISISEQNDQFASLIAKNLHLSKNYDIPLTVIYANGLYYTHYEGIVPIEMIEYDVKQAKKKLNL